MRPFVFSGSDSIISFQVTLNCCTNMKNTHHKQLAYMALVVQFIIGQLEFVEANDLAHPCLTRSRRVWVDVHTWWYGRIRISCHHPLGTVVHVSIKC